MDGEEGREVGQAASEVGSCLPPLPHFLTPVGPVNNTCFWCVTSNCIKWLYRTVSMVWMMISLKVEDSGTSQTCKRLGFRLGFRLGRIGGGGLGDLADLQGKDWGMGQGKGG